MYDQITAAVLLVVIGAAVGLILVRFAPNVCKRFHDFCMSSSSKPLHLFSIVLFSLFALTGFLNKEYFTASLSVLLTIVAVLAFSIVKRNIALADTKQPVK